jgi:hypothetical protein
MDVLYHITDDERYARALGNLARLLQPNGALILTENLVQRAQVDRHQVSRPRAVITDMLAEVGFEPVLVKPMFFLMNAPVDSDSRLLRWWWRRLVVAVGHGDAAGWLLGALTYPVELALLRWCRRGPSSKIIVCRLRRERMGHGPPLPT